MNILLLNYEYPPIGGGAANACQHMARAMVELGHEVTVMTAAFGGLRGDTDEDGVRVVRIPCPRRMQDRSGVLEMAGYVISGMRRVKDLARSRSIDGAVAFFSIPSGIVAWWLNRVHGTPYLISLRGSDVPGHDPEVRMQHALLGSFRRRILDKAVSVIAVGQALRELSEKHDRVPVRIVPNGVDTNIYFPSLEPSENAGPLRLMFVGRLRKEKNLRFLLEQIAEVVEETGDDLELHIVGDGPLADELRQTASRLGLENHVVWHGWISRQDMPGLYRHADCLVHPSLFEGMPNVILEAMASGLPVIASDIPGNALPVRGGETGFLFSLTDARGFRQAVSALLMDRQLARTMGMRGRLRVEQHFTWPAVARAYLDEMTRTIHA